MLQQGMTARNVKAIVKIREVQCAHGKALTALSLPRKFAFAILSFTDNSVFCSSLATVHFCY